jgi:hypothetical protein
MTTKLRPGDGEADKVEVTFTEQELTIKLAGKYWNIVLRLKQNYEGTKLLGEYSA